jgi:tetratricopeptide (TPR) repeat protein
VTTDFIKATLLKLNNNLNTLREREAKYGSNVPLDLLNQISDHEQAIALTEQALAGDLSETEWLAALQPLLIAGHHWQEISLAVMLVLRQYAQDNGVSLGQTMGTPASEKARELFSLVLERAKEIDPRTAQKYPENPTGYEAPLSDVLAELLEANQNLVGEFKAMLEQYQIAVEQHQASQGAPDQATLTGSGVITQKSTQRAGERGVVGSSAAGHSSPATATVSRPLSITIEIRPTNPLTKPPCAARWPVI